jgi:hypothetical protein
MQNQEEITVEVSIGIAKGKVALPTNAIEKFISAITPQFIKDTGGILSDKVRSWQLNNQIKTLQKTKEYCEKYGVPLKAVNLKFIVPLIECSSLEEDESMQKRWAALLGNAIKQSEDANPSFIDILRQLTFQEAIILDQLYLESLQKTDYKQRNTLQFSKEKVMELFKLQEEKFDLILDDLFRLNLCRTPASHNGAMVGKYPIMLQTKDFFELTSLGFAFVKACQY